jgi:hypothetical protein
MRTAPRFGRSGGTSYGGQERIDRKDRTLCFTMQAKDLRIVHMRREFEGLVAARQGPSEPGSDLGQQIQRQLAIGSTICRQTFNNHICTDRNGGQHERSRCRERSPVDLTMTAREARPQQENSAKQSVEPTGGRRCAQIAFVSQRRLPPVAHAWC